jgi:hypothetical protein
MPTAKRSGRSAIARSQLRAALWQSRAANQEAQQAKRRGGFVANVDELESFNRGLRLGPPMPGERATSSEISAYGAEARARQLHVRIAAGLERYKVVCAPPLLKKHGREPVTDLVFAWTANEAMSLVAARGHRPRYAVRSGQPWMLLP